MSTETDIAAQVEALKAQISDTKTLYREVCVLLFFRHGITPTASKLYQFVRKGSMSAPAEALAKFWEDLRGKARVQIDHPDMPDDVKALAADAIAGLWRKASNVARQELGAIRAELQNEAELARQALELANQAAQNERKAAELLKAELTAAHEVNAGVRLELEAERRAHAGTAARLQEARAQLDQVREQMLAQQEGFSADLAKARSDIQAADQRAAAAERRALLEIDQERQARTKAEKQADGLRAQVSAAEAKERQLSVDRAEVVTRLQGQIDALQSSEQRLHADNESLRTRVDQLASGLQASQQDATRFKTEAQTVQALVERLKPAPSPPAMPAAKTTRRNSAR